MPQDDQNNPFGGLQQQGQDAANNEIDQLAGKIPGGDQFSQQAKDAVDGGIGNLGQQAEGQAGNIEQQVADDLPGGLGNALGGMFGGGSNNSGNQ